MTMTPELAPILLDIITAQETHDDDAIEETIDALALYMTTHPLTNPDDVKAILQMAGYYPSFNYALRLIAESPEG